MRKEYKSDDKFKRWARALQFAYREDVLHDFNEYRTPLVLLSEENAKRGLIFYDGFRDLKMGYWDKSIGEYVERDMI